MTTKREKAQRRALRRIIIIAAVIVAAAAAVLALLAFVRPFGLDPFNTAPAPTPTSAPAPTAAQAALETPAPATPEPTVQPIQYQRSLYEASLDIDPDAMTVSGKLRLTYVSPYEEPLYSLELNMYPNAITPGCLTINGVTLNGTDVYYTGYYNYTVLIIPLANELHKGESAVVYVDYTIRLPETSDRFGSGSGGDKIMLGHSLPIASLYENGEWRRENYIGIGDCFLNSIADYKAVVSLPEEWTMLSTGTVSEQRTEGGITTYLVDAPQVREFALGAQKNAKTATVSTSSGVEVTCMGHTDEQALFGAETAANALEFYSERIGNYPYPRLCVAQFGTFGGMEYPGFVMVSDQMFDKYKDLGEYVIAHEVAHQWFYAVIGSDAVREPWVDESITEFMSLEYLRLNSRETIYEEQLAANELTIAEYDRTLRLDAPLHDFGYSTDDYAAVVYAYGAHVYRELMEEIGEEAFYLALSDYYNAHRFAQSDKAALIAAFSEAAGKDLTDWFEGKLKVR